MTDSERCPFCGGDVEEFKSIIHGTYSACDKCEYDIPSDVFRAVAKVVEAAEKLRDVPAGPGSYDAAIAVVEQAVDELRRLRG